MIMIINPENREAYWDLLDQTFVIRDRVFNGRLGWELPTICGREIDEYDSDHSYYLVSYEPSIGVYGGCRVLPTTVPYMLKHTFTQFECQDLPEDDGVWECSRFFIDNDVFKGSDVGGIKHATYELMLGLLEFGFSKNIRKFITPSEVRIERIFRLMGCPLERISKPVAIGNTLAIAANVNVYEEYFLNLQRKSGISRPVLHEC